MLTANFLGLGVGIMLSFVTGPVFFLLIKTSLEKGFLSGAALATGVLFGDSLWVIITFYGTKFIALEQKYAMLTAVIGGVFLIALGVYYLAKKVEIKYESVEDKLHLGLAGYGIKGFLITFFNPSVLVFWLTVNSLLKAVFHIQSSFDSYENLVFFTVTLLTCYTLDLLKAWYSNKLRTRIKGPTVMLMNRIAGIVIIIFGARLLLTVF